MGGRNYGIDLLRLLAMFFVVLLHQLLLSGGLEPGGLPQVYGVFWLLEVVAYGATDLFALISGYVGYREKGKRHKPSNLLFLWAQGIFYGVAVALLFCALSPWPVGWRDVLQGAFPLLTNRYWYLTAYMGLFFFMPVLDAAVRGLSSKTLARLFGAMTVVFSFVPTFTWVNFNLAEGYSLIWLMILYFFGAVIKKCRWEERCSRKQCILAWGGLLGLTWVCKILSLDKNFSLGGIPLLRCSGDGLVSYCSPTILLSAVCLLLLFSRCNLPQKLGASIARWSSGAFGVYLLNLHPCVWAYVLPWTRRYVGEKKRSVAGGGHVGFQLSVPDRRGGAGSAPGAAVPGPGAGAGHPGHRRRFPPAKDKRTIKKEAARPLL